MQSNALILTYKTPEKGGKNRICGYYQLKTVDYTVLSAFYSAYLGRYHTSAVLSVILFFTALILVLARTPPTSAEPPSETRL